MDVLAFILYRILLCADFVFGILVLFHSVSRLSAAISGEYWIPEGVMLPLQEEQPTVDCLSLAEKAKNEEPEVEHWFNELRRTLPKVGKPFTNAEIERANNMGWIGLSVRWVSYQWLFCAALVDKSLYGIDQSGLLLGFLPLLVPYKLYRDYPLGTMGLYATWTLGCIWWGHAWLTVNLEGLENSIISFVWCEKIWKFILNVGEKMLN